MRLRVGVVGVLAVVSAPLQAPLQARAEGRDLPQLPTYDPSAITARSPGGYSAFTLTNGAVLAIGGEVSSGDRECHIAGGGVVATTPGAAAVVCGGTRGQPRTEIAIVVAPVDVAAELRPIQVGVPTRVHVTVASVAQVGADLRVATPDGKLTITGLARTPRGLDMTITAPIEGPYALEVTTPGGIELGRVDADVIAVSKPRTVTRTLGEGVDWRARSTSACSSDSSRRRRSMARATRRSVIHQASEIL